MTTTAMAMLAATCKLRRSSYQPICLKMSRKYPPNPRSNPRPRTDFTRDNRKNTLDNPAQIKASEPGRPRSWAHRHATAVHRPNRQGIVSARTRNKSSLMEQSYFAGTAKAIGVNDRELETKSALACAVMNLGYILVRAVSLHHVDALLLARSFLQPSQARSSEIPRNGPRCVASDRWTRKATTGREARIRA
jgi:hypothetical protein